MADKKGTFLGRALTALIPDSSPFHTIAETADETIETIIFDKDAGVELPLVESTEVKGAVSGIKNILFGFAEKGLISWNIPGVDGENEKLVEEGILEILRGYVNEYVPG